MARYKFKTRRQSRYERLRDAHFLGFEASALSRVYLKVPYMRTVVKERLQWYQDLIAQGMSPRQFPSIVKKHYEKMHWYRKAEGFGTNAALRMLKTVEARYKLKHPDYESPWVQRAKRRAALMAKVDREYDRGFTKRKQERAKQAKVETSGRCKLYHVATGANQWCAKMVPVDKSKGLRCSNCKHYKKLKL